MRNRDRVILALNELYLVVTAGNGKTGGVIKTRRKKKQGGKKTPTVSSWK